MGKKTCKTCSGNVSGIESIPLMLIGGAVGAAVVAKKADEMLTIDAATGAPKTNADGTPAYLVANPKIKNALFLALGVAGTMYADGNEIITGLALGSAVYGGFGLVNDLVTPAAGGGAVNGLGYIPPQAINGVRMVPGNYGFSPATVAGNAQRMAVPNYQAQPEPAQSGVIKATR